MSALSWGGMSRKFFIAYPASLSQSHAEKSNFPSGDKSVRPFVISLDSLEKISSSLTPPQQLVVSEVLGHHIRTNVLHHHIFRQTQSYGLSTNIQFFCNHSNSEAAVHHSTHLFDVFIRFLCYWTLKLAVKLNFVPSFGKPFTQVKNKCF
jgi:hypothetical protein